LIGDPRLNPDAVASVVWNGFVVGPSTIVRGIESLNPGEFRLYNGAGRQKVAHTYWSLQQSAPQYRTATEQTLREVLLESVRLHLASDVPLGVFLSGGIDSSAIAHLAQKVSKTPVHTFTLAFEEAKISEHAPARAIASAIGTEHREILLAESMFLESIERALDALDQPTFDGLNTFYISKAVREAGLTVALSGTGGDELFGGYTSFRRLSRIVGWNRRTAFIPHRIKIAAARALARGMIGAAGEIAPQSGWAKMPDIVRSDADIIDLYQLGYALFLPEFQCELMAREPSNAAVIKGLPCSTYERLRREVGDERSALSAIGVLEQRCFLGERLLRDTDATSMAVSLEIRLPFVDQVVVDLVNRLPDDERFAPIGCKRLLRKVGLDGLDPALFERPKMGFVLPYEHWMHRQLGSQMDDTMNDPQFAMAVGLNPRNVSRLWRGYREGQRGLHWSRVWALYILIEWCHRNRVLL
jgi:asparagine synthase (glutamine-hydrolysing)